LSDTECGVNEYDIELKERWTMRRILGVGLCVLGLGLAIFGVVWITVIWPSLARVPADLDQETLQQGTVTLYDAEHGANATFDIINSRHYVAVGASKDIVYLNETITFTNTATDQKIPSLDASYFLAIDRVTRESVEGRGDGIGGGHYAFPFNVNKNEVYPFWNEGNPENLACKYVGETDFEGLHVYIYEMTTPVEGLATPASFDMPAMRIDQTVTQYIEPVSGVTVYMEAVTKRSGQIPVEDELFPATTPLTHKTVSFYADNLTFTQGTIDDLVGQAKSAKTQVALAKNLLPWLSIGIGIVFVAVGIFLTLKAKKPAPTPEPQVTSETKPE
jgi:hypothetical protein